MSAHLLGTEPLHQFALAPNPAEWGSHALLVNTPEPDDYLHNPDPKRDRNIDAGGHIFTARGISNLGFMAFLVLGMLMLLYVSVCFTF